MGALGQRVGADDRGQMGPLQVVTGISNPGSSVLFNVKCVWEPFSALCGQMTMDLRE